MSGLELGVERFEFSTGVVDLELPIDAGLFGGGFFGPGADFGLQDFELADATARQTLARHATQFAFRHVQPTAVLRRMHELQATDVLASLLGRKGFVERTSGVRVEVVADQRHGVAVRVACVQQLSYFQRPIDFGALWPGRRLAEGGERLHEYEDARRAFTFVVVVDALGMFFRGGNWDACFADQLHRLLVHADHGMLRVVRLGVDFQDFFQVRDEFRVGLRRDHPVLDFSLRHAVFLASDGQFRG